MCYLYVSIICVEERGWIYVVFILFDFYYVFVFECLFVYVCFVVDVFDDVFGLFNLGVLFGEFSEFDEVLDVGEGCVDYGVFDDFVGGCDWYCDCWLCWYGCWDLLCVVVIGKLVDWKFVGFFFCSCVLGEYVFVWFGSLINILMEIVWGYWCIICYSLVIGDGMI